MASPAMSTRHHSLDVAEQCPLFGGDISDWWALQPSEQAEVILASYQERVVPELARIERLLTYLAIEYGLEYCRLEEIAVLFLDVAQEIRDHVRALEASVASPAHDRPDVANADMSVLIDRLDSITRSCEADGADSFGFAKLIDGLRKCQQELAALLILESEMTK